MLLCSYAVMLLVWTWHLTHSVSPKLSLNHNKCHYDIYLFTLIYNFLELNSSAKIELLQNLWDMYIEQSVYSIIWNFGKYCHECPEFVFKIFVSLSVSTQKSLTFWLINKVIFLTKIHPSDLSFQAFKYKLWNSLSHRREKSHSEQQPFFLTQAVISLATSLRSTSLFNNNL